MPIEPHKIRVYRELKGVEMSDLPPVCHRNYKKYEKGLNFRERVQPLYFYEVFRPTVCSKRSTDRAAMASVSCT